MEAKKLWADYERQRYWYTQDIEQRSWENYSNLNRLALRANRGELWT